MGLINITDNDNDVVDIDGLLGSLNTLDGVHHQIHEKNQAGALDRSQNEFILKSNKKYAIVYKNESGTANYIGYRYNWYEK